ncbi:CHASE2 domain-containing protein [Caballeronia udeis]|nr:adenylate/guanylate cyclase domain-containing protein [Caballeronia udeis]
MRLTLFALISLIAWLLGTGLWSPEPYRRVGFALDDWRQSYLLSDRHDRRIALIDIDERSLDAIGPWPWPRAVIAQIARNLFEQYHAKVVGLDILLPERGDAEGDSALLALGHRYPLVFAQAFDLSGDPDAPHTGHINSGRTEKANASRAPVASGFVANFFDDSDVCAGHVTPHADPDGVVRSIAPLIQFGGLTYPMFAWQLMTCRGAERPLPVSIESLPTNRRGLMNIPFQLGMRSFDVISALDVLAGTAPPALLTNRRVLIGSSSIGLTDHVASPIEPWLPAVVVHAELLSYLLDSEARGAFITSGRGLSMLWTACSIIIFALLFRRQRAPVALTVLLVTTSIWLAFVFSTRAVAAGLAALPLVPAAVYMLIQAPIEWISSQAEIRSFERRFSLYLPPTVLREIVRRRGLKAFTPERRQISVLFVDIEGYTRLAEQVPPEQLATMTDVILTRLTQCVYDTDGTLDKYIGDSLMAFWGAPLEQLDHADRALDCARAMLHEVDALNRCVDPVMGGQTIRVRIGVNSGGAVVGELGSTFRQSYTAIGDAVNVASRLQDYAKVVKTDLLIGQETGRLVNRHALRTFGNATLRGRITPELLYVLEEVGTDAAH